MMSSSSQAPATTNGSRSEKMRSLAEEVSNDEMLKELHDAMEQDLINYVCKWSHGMIVYGAGAAACLLYLNGQDVYINPLIVSLVGIFASFFSLQTQTTLTLSFIALAGIKHALSQGCSASLVPAIYGFLPCAFGFLFRTTRAIVISTIGVLAAVFCIFAVDLSGHCTSEPILESEKVYIVADRLVPLLVLILGNCAVLTAIARQSQKSLLLHAKAARSAAKLADVRRDVLHRVTHELRTPLNGIVGSVELLTTSETMDESDLENALTIKSCLQSIVRICDDVLMAAKSKTDDRERKETVFMLASCVDDVAEIFAAAAAAKGIKLKVDFVGNTTVMVRGMEVELRQVLLNLVGNAIKFTDSGSVTIRCREDPSPSPNVLNCTFEIEDTGVGLADENTNMLFEAFHQGEQGAVSRHHKGTGLGLTICKDFVELMGGKIDVDSSHGQGSRFHFSLSFKKELWASSADSITEPTDQSTCRIVIADSEKESSRCCQSVVKTVAPSAMVSVVDSSPALVDLVASDRTVTETHRVVFLECESFDTDCLLSTLARLKQAGWLVFAYCDQFAFPHLVTNSLNAYAVFRRPLPLVRMGDSLRNALAGGAPSIRKRPKSVNDAAIMKAKTEQENTAKEKMAHERKSRSSVTFEDARPPQAKVEASPPEMSGGKNVSPKETMTTSSPSTFRVKTKKESSKASAVELRPGSKVIVVDDTPVNVKVLVKMISRSTSVPIVSCFDGASAIEVARSSRCEDLLLFLMDWHMPGVCGLTATDTIRKLAKERGGPSVFVCMVTADIEGLQSEMERRDITCEGTISKGKLTAKDGETGLASASESEDETALERSNDEFTVVDIVAEKPVTFKSIQAILTWFQQQVEGTG